MERITLITKSTGSYELIDSGNEEKLERFGDFVLSRPDPQALWPKQLSESEWQKVNAKFERNPSTSSGQGGKWTGNVPKEWQIAFGDLNFLIKPTSFKHVGLFPEQLPNWEWTTAKLASQLPSTQNKDRDNVGAADRQVSPSILNLFAYTGGATLAAAKAGASVTHVDASKTAVEWARENAKISGLDEKPIRWIIEDALTFVKREIKRGVRYDGIIMDPPAFGHGPKNELWKIEEDLIELIKLCGDLLSDKPLFFLINGYAAGYSSLAFAYNLEPLIKKFGGSIEHGDLTIEEKGSDRLLPCGIFARWRRGN